MTVMVHGPGISGAFFGGEVYLPQQPKLLFLKPVVSFHVRFVVAISIL